MKASYHKAIVKLTNTQLSKLKLAAKNKTETILRINKKNLEDKELDLKESNDLVDNEVVKNTKFTTLKAKVNNLEKKPLIQLL